MGIPQDIHLTPEDEAALDEAVDEAVAEAEAERVAQAVALGYPAAVAAGGVRAMRLYDLWQARRDALERGEALPPLPEDPGAAGAEDMDPDAYWHDPLVLAFMRRAAAHGDELAAAVLREHGVAEDSA